ncbi:flagellar basal body L-ring protein FlgH [Sphingomonas montana]|uniref:flagellar basal body L-ring protein FlgH n=1 Tax=Sphingomonas montana TaxID=1843236 RepID=UPI00096E9B39|nr:flagellar basal body L-ring protein FlgH [Sphingomonas montana]
MAAGLAFAVHANPVDARRPKTPPVSYAASMPVEAAAPVANGGIYQASTGYAALTSGARAARIGDTLSIVLVERTQAVKSNSASTDRNGNIGLTPPAVGPLSFFRAAEASVGGGSTFAGTGSATQANALTGEVTVTVERVLPNGNLMVRGEKQVTLNRGDEYIRISGIVRPADILPDNRVASTSVADARITYSGSGEIARASRAGWLNRFFTMLSPF